MTYYKGTVFGYKQTYISKDSIGSVSLKTGLLFSTVIIESNGGKTIVAEGFTRGDAEDIRDKIRRKI